MTSSADGSVIIDVNMNVDKAEKELAKLKQNIEKTEREISDIRQKRDEARQKSALDAGVLDAEKAKLQEIKDRLSDIRAMAKDKSLSVDTREYAKSLIPSVQQELADQRERVRGLQTSWNKITSEAERYDQKLKDAEATLEQQKIQAGSLQQQINDAEKRRADIAQNAEVSDRNIVELNRELAELKARQAELEQAGLGLGYKEYDENAARIAEITRALKEYQKALSGQGGGEPDKPIDRTAAAADRLNSILSKAGGLLKSVGDASLSAFNAVGKAVSSAAKGTLSIVKRTASVAKNMNALSKVTDVVEKKLRRLWQMFRRVFIFSVITSGLRSIRSQLSSYLTLNAEFSTALSRLKGVLLTAFQPIYDAVLPALTALINVLSRAIAAVSEFIAVLFGTTAKRAQENAKALYSQAGATSAAGDAAEKASLQMASFDEINKLEGNKSGGGGGGGGGGAVDTGPLFDWEYEDTPFESCGEAFSAFLDKMLAGIPALKEKFKDFADWLNDLNQKLYDMFTFPGVLDKVKQLGRDLADALNDLVNWIDWELWGRALGAGLNLALNFLTSFLYRFNWMNLGRKLAEFINGLGYEIDWYEFGRLLWAGFKIAIETLAGFILGLDMPFWAKAASDIITAFFTEMKNTIEKIPWREIGEKIREFLVNIKWKEIFDAVWGAIKAAFNASSEFFSGLLGEELKRQLTDMLITISKYTLVIGALLALTGANIPLGLGLMAVGAASLAAAALLDWEYVTGKLSQIISDIALKLGAALLVIGAILTLSGSNIPLGLGLMAAGAVSLATALAMNWDFIPTTIQGIVTAALVILSAALLVLGAILTFSSANVPLGIGLIALGAASLVAAVAINWDSIPYTIEQVVSNIAAVLGTALLVIGAVLTFSSANIPLGIGLIALGAVSLATAVAINWEILPNNIEGVISKVTAILSVAFLVLGAILTFSGANIPLGLGLLVAGAVGLAATIADNWETIQPKLQGALGAVEAIASAAVLALGVVLLFTGAGIPLGLGLIALGAAGLATTIAENWDSIPPKVQTALDAVKAVASVALLALGVVLIFTGAGIPLGLGMIAIGALGLASLIEPNWGGILEKLQETWGNITSWWQNGPSKYFKLEYWKGVGKDMVDGFLGGLQAIWTGLSNWASDVRRTIENAFSSASTKAGRVTSSTPQFYTGSRMAEAPMPKLSSFNIPALAQGAVIPPNREFLAVLGDQRNGTNIETPLSTMVQAFKQALNEGGYSGGNKTVNVTLELERQALGHVMFNLYNEESKRIGVRLTEVKS